MLFKNIAHVGSFKHFVFVYLRIFVIVYLCILHLIHGNFPFLSVTHSHHHHHLSLHLTRLVDCFERACGTCACRFWSTVTLLTYLFIYFILYMYCDISWWRLLICSNAFSLNLLWCLYTAIKYPKLKIEIDCMFWGLQGWYQECRRYLQTVPSTGRRRFWWISRIFCFLSFFLQEF